MTVFGMREIVCAEIGHTRFEIALTPGEALEKVLATPFDLVLLDMSLGGRSGLEVLAEIRRHKPSTPVLIVSMHPEELYAVRALKAGAAGYLGKDAPVAEVVTAIRQVLSGEKYISRKGAQGLARYFEKESERPLHEKLSGREFEVLCLIGKGMAIKEIAGHLNLSVKTVSTYRARILSEMKLERTSDLIRYCLKAGLVEG